MHEVMTDHRSYTDANYAVTKLKPEKNFRHEIRTHDLCDTDAVLYQLSYQANCKGAGYIVSSQYTRRW